MKNKTTFLVSTQFAILGGLSLLLSMVAFRFKADIELVIILFKISLPLLFIGIATFSVYLLLNKKTNTRIKPIFIVGSIITTVGIGAFTLLVLFTDRVQLKSYNNAFNLDAQYSARQLT